MVNLGRYFAVICFLCFGLTSFAQQEKLPNTNVPLNRLDVNGKRNGPWWISNPSVKGEPSTAEFGNYDVGTKYGKWYKIDNEGDIIAVESFRNDMLDGEVKYYAKGVLYCSGSYKTYRSGAETDTIMVVDAETHEQSLKEIHNEYYTVRHGTWRFFDEETGKLLRTEEYDTDSLVKKSNYISPQDSTFRQKRESAMPHNKKKIYKPPPGKRETYIVN